MVMLARCISKQWLSKYVYGSLRDITPTPLLPPSPFLYLQQRIKNFSFPEQYDMNFSKLCLYFFLPSAPHLVFFSSSAPSPPPKKRKKLAKKAYFYSLVFFAEENYWTQFLRKFRGEKCCEYFWDILVKKWIDHRGHLKILPVNT